LSHTDEIKQKKQQIKVNAGKKRIENSVRQTRITISGNNVTIDTDKSESKSITSNDDYLKQRFCVLEDNLQILNQTLSFEVFYSKYRIAVREAKAIEQYCDEHDISSAITYAAVAFLEDDVQIFNDFFDRCEAREVLHNIRHQVELRRYDIPAQSFDYFMRLCMRYNDSTDKQEYVFCSVVFSKGGKTYYYLSENANVCCGDYVRVPVGDDNKIETARVIKVEIVQGKYAPYPVNKLKYIQLI